MDDVLEYTARNNISGLLEAIDFQKVFHLIKQSFMAKAFSAFNFGPSLIHWIQTFYKNYCKHSHEQWLYNNSFSNS